MKKIDYSEVDYGALSLPDFVDYPMGEQLKSWELDAHSKKMKYIFTGKKGHMYGFNSDCVTEAQQVQKQVWEATCRMNFETDKRLRYLVNKLEKSGKALSQWIGGYYGEWSSEYTDLINIIEKASDEEIEILEVFFENGIVFLGNHETKIRDINVSNLREVFKLKDLILEEKNINNNSYSKKELNEDEIVLLCKYLSKGKVKDIKKILTKLIWFKKQIKNKDANRYSMVSVDFYRLLKDGKEDLLKELLELDPRDMRFTKNIMDKIEDVYCSLEEFLEANKYLNKHRNFFFQWSPSKKDRDKQFYHYPNFSLAYFARFKNLKLDKIEENEDEKRIKRRNEFYGYANPEIKNNELVQHHAFFRNNFPETVEILDSMNIELDLKEILCVKKNNNDDRGFKSHIFTHMKRISNDLSLLKGYEDFITEKFQISNLAGLYCLAVQMKRDCEDFWRRSSITSELLEEKIDLNNSVHFYIFFYIPYLQNFFDYPSFHDGVPNINSFDLTNIDGLKNVKKICGDETLFAPWKITDEYRELNKQYSFEEDIPDDQIWREDLCEKVPDSYLLHRFHFHDEKQNNHDNRQHYERNEYLGKGLERHFGKCAKWKDKDKEILQEAFRRGFFENKKNIEEPERIRALLSFPIHDVNYFLSLYSSDKTPNFSDENNFDFYFACFRGDISVWSKVKYATLKTEDFENIYYLFPNDFAEKLKPKLLEYIALGKDYKQRNEVNPFRTNQILFLEIVYYDDPDFLKEVFGQYIENYKSCRRFSLNDDCLDLFEHIIKNDLDWMDEESLYQEILLYFDDYSHGNSFFEFIFDKFQLEKGITNKNWQQALLLRFKSVSHSLDDGLKEDISIVCNCEDGMKVMRKNFADFMIKVVEKRELNKEELLIEEKLKYSACNDNFETFDFVNISTGGEVLMYFLDKELKNYPEAKKWVEKCFAGKLYSSVDLHDLPTPPKSQKTTSLQEGEGKKELNFCLGIIDEFLKIQHDISIYRRKKREEKPQERHKCQKNLYLLSQKINKTKNTLADYKELQKEIERMINLLYLEEYMSLSHLSNAQSKQGKIELSPFLQDTNEHTKTAISSMSLLLASGAIKHPKINQTSLEQIPSHGGDLAQMTQSAISKYHKTLTKNIELVLPVVEEAILTRRQETAGLMPVGGKVHIISDIDSTTVNFMQETFGLSSSPFKLIHAGESVLLPPSVTDLELGIYIEMLKHFGNIDQFDIQSCVSGRLDRENAPIVGAVRLLATSYSKEYQYKSCSTTHDGETGARFMAYDAGVKETGLPFDLPQARGRTDVLGGTTIGDNSIHQFTQTLMAHKQFGGDFDGLGIEFSQKFIKILEKHDLDFALHKSAWVYDHALQSSDSTQNHYDMLKTFTDKVREDNQRPDKGILFDTHCLMLEAQKEMNKIRKRCIAVPKNPEYQKLMTW